LPAAFHIAIEIVRALDFAHGHNVVHRDISPSNILISRAGEVKIADFGIAVAAQPHKYTAPGLKRVMGKWRYMSPEQTRGDTLDDVSRKELADKSVVRKTAVTHGRPAPTELAPGEVSTGLFRKVDMDGLSRLEEVEVNTQVAAPRARRGTPGFPSTTDHDLQK